MFENFGWLQGDSGSAVRTGVEDPRWVRIALIVVTISFLGLFLFVPLAAVFVEAFKKGVGAYFAAIFLVGSAIRNRVDVDDRGIAVPLNVAFGPAAAWAIARSEFPEAGPAHPDRCPSRSRR